ncbi:MAG: Xaa-Pro peptidase family protein [Bacillota bacterium]|nr:Xaa-Pro peptidase family protein [Bacillota bacterium]
MVSVLREKMSQKGLDSLILCDPDSIYYFTGCKIAPGERMFVLLVTQNDLKLILPEMFSDESKTASKEVARIFFKDTDDYISYVTDSLKNHKRIGVDKYLVAKFLLPFMSALPESAFVDGSAVVDFMRMHKNPEECEKMRISSHLNDKIIGDFAKFLALPSSIGISEKEAAKKLIEVAEANGVEGISFEPIVSFGSGTAQPHHEPASDVFLKPNSPVILDIGFIKNGYCSDMTRSFFRTEDAMVIADCRIVKEGVDGVETTDTRTLGAKLEMSAADSEKWNKFHEIYDIVKRANLAGIAKVAPGVPLAEVDAAARNLIADAGYGEFFTHRLGHGIGIAVHEFPDVSSASEAVCAEGMIFSIEPGIYHMESGIGIRVEDLVLVTKDGCEVLNRYPK